MPQLLDDIVVPSYCSTGDEPQRAAAINCWLGPAGTVSPLHTDPHHNVFVQLVGQKAVLLHAASESERL